jgi:dipeptidyl aminopeptidase/acylaminoacyl peptidase
MKERALLGFVLCMAVWSVPSPAFEARPLRVEDILSLKEFSEFTPLRFSPDGQRLVYAAKDNRKRGINALDQYPRTGVPLNGFGSDLFIAQVATGEVTNLTGGVGNNWAPAWSPDGRYLAFLSDRDGSGQGKLWVCELSSGQMWKASDKDARGNEIQWLPDNQDVLLTVLPANLTPAEYADRLSGATEDKTVDLQEEVVAGSTVLVYHSGLGRSGDKANGPWNLERSLRDLVLVNIHSGKVKYIDHGHRIAAYSLSPDGSKVALTTAKRFEKAASQQVLFDLTVFEIEPGEQRVLASDVPLRPDGSSFSWSPDSARLVYQTGGPDATGDCYVAEFRGLAPRNVTNLASRLQHGVQPPVWDPQGDQIYFLAGDSIWKVSLSRGISAKLARIRGHRTIELVAKDGIALSNGNRRLLVLTYDDEQKQSGFYEVDPGSGDSTNLLEKKQSYGAAGQQRNVATSPSGDLLAFVIEDAEHTPDIWITSSDLRVLRQLTHLNPNLRQYQTGAARLIEWRSLEGQLLHGVLLLPSGYTAGRNYPLVVCVYGGASLSNLLAQFGPACGGMNMQLLATRGYAVLLPDAPQRVGTPMYDLAKTILPGVEKTIELGIADPSRLGIMGHSYGGYSVMCLLVETARFKAAIAVDGFGDLIAAYGQMNKDGSSFGQSAAETGQMLMGSTLWQLRDRYVENSPVFYLDRIETPVLLVHGSADPTVSSFLTDELFAGLRRLNKEVAYAKYEDEGHSPLDWSYANQIDYCSRVIQWFDRNLK